MKVRARTLRFLVFMATLTASVATGPPAHASTPPAASLVSPSGSGITNPVTYTWNAAPSSTWYYLWVNGPTGNAVYKQWYTAAQAGCGGGTGTCQVTPSVAFGGGDHWWWIQTWNPSGYGPWSAAMMFTVSGSPGRTTLISPTGGGITNPVTYTWNAVSSATWYYLWVNGPSGNVLKRWYTAAQAACSTTCRVTPSITLAAGEHRWWIQTWNTGGYGPWSAPRTFNVPGDLSNARIKLTEVAAMDQPIAMAVRPGDGTLYVAEKGGRIKAIRDGAVVPGAVLDISNEVSTGGEQGLLGLTFNPAGDKLYVSFTDTLGDSALREYGFSTGAPQSPRLILAVDQPFANHNGGNIRFGPDGFLYIGLGDGGSGGDPQGNGQNLETLLGKMLRIDPTPPPTGAAYTIPASNPLVGKSGRDEIWSWGLRNPWRWSFDRDTGDLWIGDVGQNAWEEIDFQPAASPGGDNYGWNLMEGTHSFNGGSPPAGHDPPIYEYSHDGGNCSVTGGYVYRGSRIPDLEGAYVFGDYCVGELRAFKLEGGTAVGHRLLGAQADALASFGEDQNGELYALSLLGPIYRIDPL